MRIQETAYIKKGLIILSFMILFVGTARAQDDRAGRMQRAMQEIASGSYVSGIDSMKTLVHSYPEFVAAWTSLGVAQRRSQELRASLSTFEEAIQSNPDNPGLMFQLGMAYGYLDQLDEAFDWLYRTKESGAINLTSIGLLPVAAHLTKDSRYRGLYPSAEEFSDPFVEPTRIIHEWRGENQGDQFSWIARNIGDVDKDGIDDLVASAPTNSDGGLSAGKIYVYSGRSGSLLWSRTGEMANGQLGSGVEAAGDVNADGTPDVIAGAPFAYTAYVYSGSDGALIHTLVGSDSTGGYGNAVKGIGDVNGDGHADLLIGEPFQIFGGPFNGGSLQNPGRAHVVSGADGSTLITLKGEKDTDGFGTAVSGSTTEGVTTFVIGAPGAGDDGKGRIYVYRVEDGGRISDDPFFKADADETGSNFGGMFLSVVGDVNADGTPDIYASDFGDAELGPSTGKVYIFSGSTGKRLFAIGGSLAGEGFGIGISDAGDVDKDGHADLVVGAWQHGGAAPSGGKVYVYSGRTGDLLSTITGKVAGETFGFDTTGMGDVDGDGTVDFLITSTWSAVNGPQSGRMFILSGK